MQSILCCFWNVKQTIAFNWVRVQFRNKPIFYVQLVFWCHRYFELNWWMRPCFYLFVGEKKCAPPAPCKSFIWISRITQNINIFPIFLQFHRTNDVWFDSQHWWSPSRAFTTRNTFFFTFWWCKWNSMERKLIHTIKRLNTGNRHRRKKNPNNTQALIIDWVLNCSIKIQQKMIKHTHQNKYRFIPMKDP